MATIEYKGFRVYYVDPTTLEHKQYAGSFEWCICKIDADTGSFPFSFDNHPISVATARVLIAGTMGGWTYQDLGGMFMGRYEQNNPSAMEAAYQNVLQVAPKSQQLLKNETGQACKVKLVGTNGYYAISQNTVANNAYYFGASSAPVYMDLYNETGVMMKQSSELGALAYYTNSIEIVFQYNFSGTVTAGTVLHGLIMGSTSEQDKVTLFRYQRNDSYQYTQEEADWINALSPLPPPVTDPYAGIDGESEIQGEPGTDTGSIALPSMPALAATSAGIIGLFNPSEQQMRDLADFMWTDFGGSSTDVLSALEEIVQAIKRMISDPLKYVIGLNIVPSQGLSVGAPDTVRFGFISSGVSMPRLISQFFTVNCGSVTFSPLCNNTFLDYAPYSKFSIYLPYIGVKELDANDCVGHTIGVVYHGDVVTGGITAYVTKDGSVMYQFSGSCALNVPLNSDNWGSTLAAAVQIATAVFTGGAAAGSAGIAANAVAGAASVAANPSLLSPQVSRSGAVSGAAGCMGVQKPYVIREAVRFHNTAGFNTQHGYPSFYWRLLDDVSGYTKVLNVHLHGIEATSEELQEIERLLKEGVIL